MKTKINFLIAGLVILVASCNSKSNKQSVTTLSHSNLITISGAYALAPIMQVWMTEYKKSHPYVNFKMDPNGSGEGLTDLIAGKVDFAMVSEDIPKAKDSTLWIMPVASLGVVPVISAKNPYLKEIMNTGITKENLVSLFSGQNKISWGELAGKSVKDPVKVYRRADSSGATVTLASYLALKDIEIKGIPVKGEIELVTKVKSDPLAISYCNFIYAFDQSKKVFLDDLKIVPIIISGKDNPEATQKIFDTYEHLQRAMWLGRYPSLLIRDLNLVSNRKPRTKEMIDFMRWIITDGQRFIPDNGYIELHSSEVQSLVNNMKSIIQ